MIQSNQQVLSRRNRPSFEKKLDSVNLGEGAGDQNGGLIEVLTPVFDKVPTYRYLRSYVDHPTNCLYAKSVLRPLTIFNFVRKTGF